MYRSVFAVLAGMLVISLFLPGPAGAGKQGQTSMKHSPPSYFVSGHRIQVEADVSDPAGIELVRCYFRAAGEADFVFVPMTHTRRSRYAAVLPAPSADTRQVEYLVLSVNGENEIVKSQLFHMEKEDRDRVPAWQSGFGEDEIVVSMELDQVPAELAGFSDNIVIDQVESGLRFGVVAGGLYQVAGGASVSGTAAGATSAGTVTAGSAGLGTTTLVAAGAGAAAAAGGAAAAVSSDSSSSSGSGSRVEDHYIASGPLQGDGSPPHQGTFQVGEGVVAYNFIQDVEQGDTSYTLWQSPDGSTIRIDNPPATSDGSMSFSSYLEPGRTATEGTWSVSFYYNGRNLYTDTFVVTSGSGVTVYWTY